MPSTTSNTSPATPAVHPDIPPFPSPSTFSILPDIWLLLARLNILHQQPQQQQQTTQAQTNGHHQPQQQQAPSSQHGHPPSQTAPSSTPSQQSQVLPTQSQSQSQLQPPPTSSGTGSTTAATATATAPVFHGAPLLDLKDLPAQIYPLKQRLAKARAAVTALPDVARTVDEQEAEIRTLERMVKGLRGRLGLLGEMAASATADAAAAGSEEVQDVEMKDEPEAAEDRVEVKKEHGVVERGGGEPEQREGEEG